MWQAAGAADGAGATIGKWFGFAKQMVKESQSYKSLAQDGIVGGVGSERVVTAEEPEFQALAQFSRDLGEKINGLNARCLERSQLGFARSEAITDIGLSTLSLGQIAEDGSVPVEKLAEFSDLEALHASSDGQHMSEQLELWVGIVNALKGAVKKREDSRLGLQASRDHVHNLKQKQSTGQFVGELCYLRTDLSADAGQKMYPGPELESAEEALASQEGDFSKVHTSAASFVIFSRLVHVADSCQMLARYTSISRSVSECAERTVPCVHEGNSRQVEILF